MTDLSTIVAHLQKVQIWDIDGVGPKPRMYLTSATVADTRYTGGFGPTPL